MRHRHVDASRTGRQHLTCHRGKRAAGAGHVVDDDDMVTGQVGLRQGHLDFEVAAPLLAAHRRAAAGRGCRGVHPRCGFGVRAEHPGTGTAQRSTEERSRRERLRAFDRDGFVQRADAVKVRIDGHDAVEKLREPAADDALADRFARSEGDVLPHVGEIRSDQREVARTQCARGARGEQQFDQFFVRVVQRAQHHDRRGQRVRAGAASVRRRGSDAARSGRSASRRPRRAARHSPARRRSEQHEGL